ncbi:rCG22873 [Rattus norvegicus]|uniref:RCG22873 n=1 Tax=Rattus norvegicus TaxID=10116 RepID=A6KPC1_RAT|nr:rCG22873 [Rattus norvegicus]
MPNKLNQKIKSSQHIITKTLNIQKKERILKAVRKKSWTIDFSMKTLKAKRARSDVP